MGFGDPIQGDVLLALRRWRRTPLATAAAILTLAVVIGAEGLLLSSIDLVLLRKLPYAEPERLVFLWERNPSLGLERASVSADNFADWRRESRSFAGMAAVRPVASLLEMDNGIVQVRNARVSPNFFSVLGLRPALGRVFGASKEPGDEIVLSYQLWTDAFGADPGVLGRSFRLDGRPFVIVGVVPPGAELPKSAELWTPAAFDRESAGRAVRSLVVVGLLRPNVSLDAAQAEMSTVAQQLERLFPDENRGFGAAVASLQSELTRNVRPTLLFLFGASTLALLIGCVNLSNLELVRVARQRREFALRRVLGADGFLLWRPVLVDSLLLSAAGGILGFLAALWAGPQVMALSPSTVGLSEDRLLLPLVYSVAFAALLAALLCSAAPILYLLSTRARDLARQVKGTGGGSLRLGRLQRVLLVLQITLSLPLLVGGFVLLQNFLRLQRIDLGFQPDGLLAIGVTLPDAGSGDAGAVRAVVTPMLDRVANLPWVSRAAVVSDLPYRGASTMTTFTIEGRPHASGEIPPMAEQRSVSAGYFEAAGIHLVRGRTFSVSDDLGTPTVCIVNKTMARRFWPDEDPVGKTLYLGSPQEIGLYGRPVPWRIVGVVGDVRHVGVEADFRPEIYLPQTQMPVGFLNLLVRVREESAVNLADLRAALTGPERWVRAGNIQSMDEAMDEAVGRPGIQTFFFVLFMTVSVLLVAMSTYALVAHSVSQGARGIGIVIALGAETRNILYLILREMALLCAAGLLAGILLGLAGVRVLAHTVYLLSGSGFAAYGMAVVLLASLVAFAGILPARRALGLDPTRLLQREA